MPFPDSRRPLLTPTRAIAASLLLHLLILCVTLPVPRLMERGAQRLSATLAPRAAAPEIGTQPADTPLPDAGEASPRSAISPLRHHSPASLDAKPRDTLPAPAPVAEATAQPDRQAQTAAPLARSASGNGEATETVPETAPVEPFSLDLYFDALVNKLNRSAAFVRHDPRSQGVRGAAVVIRVNPDGSLKSFEILEAADRQDEIAFIRSVVDRAAPFAAFPEDLRKAAPSLAMRICIQPARAGSGFGFSRNTGWRGC